MSTGYYQKNTERLRKKYCEIYQNLSKEDKNKKQKYGRKQYRNISGIKTPKSINILVTNLEIFQKMKKRLVEYRKNNSKTQKIKTD